MQWPVKDEDSDSMVPAQPKEVPADTVIVDDFDRSYSKFHDCPLLLRSLDQLVL